METRHEAEKFSGLFVVPMGKGEKHLRTTTMRLHTSEPGVGNAA